MRIIIDCDEFEVEISDEVSAVGFVDVTTRFKEDGDGRSATVSPNELIKALQAFL